MNAVAQPTENTAPPARRRLSRATKIAYGVGDIGGSAVGTISGFFLTAFLLDVAGMRPGAVGIIFLISQIWDAMIDPYIGLLCDRTHTRWGSKRPWILFGAVPFALAYVLMWVVPDLDQAGLFVYYLVVTLLLRTAWSAVGVPFSALAVDLTQDYNERTQLNTYRSSFSIFGGLLALSTHPLLVGLGGGDQQRGHLIAAGMWAVFIVITLLVAFFFTYERPPSAAQHERSSMTSELRIALQNRPFRIVTSIFLLSWTCLLFVQNNLLLYVRYWADAEAQFVSILLVFQITAIVFLSVWNRVCRRIGKRAVYIVGAAIWMSGLVALFWAPRGVVLPYYVIAFVTGMGAAVAYLIPASMLPDVVDYDELRTGQRRDGVFYGMFVLLQQIGLSLGLAASGLALEAAGYVNPVAGELVAQPPSVLLTLRLLVSFVPAALLLVSLPVAFMYPITQARFADIRRQLAERA